LLTGVNEWSINDFSRYINDISRCINACAWYINEISWYENPAKYELVRTYEVRIEISLYINDITQYENPAKYELVRIRQWADKPTKYELKTSGLLMTSRGLSREWRSLQILVQGLCAVLSF
jgi:hypothetical protein